MKRSRLVFGLFMVLLLVGLLSSCVSPVFAASDHQLATYAFTNNAAQMTIRYVHPSAISDPSAVAMNFLATSTGYLTHIWVQLYTYGSPSLSFAAALYGNDNSSSAAPNATLYATSDVHSTAEFAGQYIVTDIDFAFNQTYQVVAGNYYSFIVYISSASVVDGANNLRVYFDNSGSYSSGGLRIYNNNAHPNDEQSQH